MRFTSIILQAAVASASVIPASYQGKQGNENSHIQAKGKPAKPDVTDLLVNHNPEDSKTAWEETVPELEHVGLAKRAPGDPKDGAAYVAGVRDRGAKFMPNSGGDHYESDRRDRDRDYRDEDHERDQEHEG